MGCWNQTCGLTQLHIRAGEPVLVLALSTSHRDSLCYTTPFFTPFPVPFYSTYNDYGSGEDSSGVGLQLTLDYIQSHLVEIDQGDNRFHDIPVTKTGFGEDMFWEAIHEQRLQISGYGEKSWYIGMVMIKQSVFDHLVENYQFETYDYDANTRKSTYYKYKFGDILAGVPEIADMLLNTTDSTILRMSLRCVDGINMEEDGSPRKLSSDKYNYAASWLDDGGSHLKHGGGWSSQIINRAIETRSREGDRAGMIELLNDHLKLLFIDSVMMHTRKFWSPQAGAGSQNAMHDGYRALAAAVDHALNIENAEDEE